MTQQSVAVFHNREDLRLLYDVVLSHEGYIVRTYNAMTTTSENVVPKLLEVKPDLTILSVDFGHKIRPKEGIEALVQIRNHPELRTHPVIIDAETDEYEREALENGANVYIGASKSNEVLVEKVRELIGQ